jgi:uncharacterized protein YecE (DUF72 family)
VKRLQNAEQATDAFLDVASALGEKQGPILFQLPPSFKKDVARLDAFLKHIAGRAKVAFEFRSETWFGQELVDCLRTHSAALVAAQGDDLPESGIIPTTDWTYLRLSSAEYSDDQLREWLQQIREHNFANSYTVFMHEGTGIGPKRGLRFMELAREAGL